MPESKPDLSERPTGFRWVVFAMACSTSWMLYLHRYTFGLIKPALEKEWGVENTELGLLDSTFSLFYSLFQFPLGIAGDALGVHLVLTALILIWTCGLALHARAASVELMHVPRATVAIGQSAVYACLSRITRTWFPDKVRTSVQGWVGVFFGRIGGVSAMLIFGFFMLGVVSMNWRSAIVVIAAPGLLLAMAFAILFRNSPRTHWLVNRAEADLIEGPLGTDPSPTVAKRMSVREMFRRMTPLSIANLLFLCVQSILSTAADNIYSSWIPKFLSDVHHLNYKEMGIYSALPLLGGAIGGACGGFLNDWMIRRTGSRRWARSLVGLGSKGFAAIMLLITLAVWYEQPYVFCGMLFVVKLFSDAGLATTWGAVTDMGGRATATVFAFNNAVAGVGSFVAPTVYGYVADEYGWVRVFVLGAACYGACALSWLLVNSSRPVIGEGDVHPAE